MKRRQRYKEIQLGQLRSFCLAAAQGNFTVAAKMSGLSLSTVWEQIRSLEQNLGVTLLLREGRNVALTPEGQLLLDVARPSVEQLDSLHELFDGRKYQPPRRLTLATSPYTLQHILPRTMKVFTERHPKVHISVQFAESFNVEARVERGDVDVALHAFDPEDRRSPALDYEEMVALPLQLLVASLHPLARKRKISLVDVLPNPVILVGLKTFAG